jgi:4-amino-4-deoxy-L-arabinose transferase-like glycosyltransferase
VTEGTPRPRILPLTVGHALALGLVARLIALVALPPQNFFDAHTYVDAGRELFTTGRIANDLAMPLYPIWVYLAGGFAGSAVAPHIADILLSTATIWLLYRLTLELFADRVAALLAAFAAALYPHFVFFAVTGLTETAYIFLTVLAFLLLYRARYFWGSVALVASILVRPSLDLLAPILIVVFALIVHRAGWRMAAVKLGQYVLVYLVLMTPWWVHNEMKYGQFVRLDLGGGMIMYLGNNPANKTGGGVCNERYCDHDRKNPAWQIRDPIEKDRALFQAGVGYIRDHPGRFVEMAGVKFLRFWRLWPYDEDYRTPLIIAASLLSYAPALLLACVYLMRRGVRDGLRTAPILLYFCFLTAVHIITIASVRYRLPLEPFLIVFGMTALADLAAKVPRLDRMLGALFGAPRAGHAALRQPAVQPLAPSPPSPPPASVWSAPR